MISAREAEKNSLGCDWQQELNAIMGLTLDGIISCVGGQCSLVLVRSRLVVVRWCSRGEPDGRWFAEVSTSDRFPRYLKRKRL